MYFNSSPLPQSTVTGMVAETALRVKVTFVPFGASVVRIIALFEEKATAKSAINDNSKCFLIICSIYL